MIHSTKIDLYQEVTNRVILLLEQGVAPWRCPWKGYGLARNHATGHLYRGINALLMHLTPHPIPYFMSFKQAKAQGGHIRKGARSEQVYYYTAYYKDGNGKTIDAQKYAALQKRGEEARRIAFLKYYRVFNIADVKGIAIETPQVTLQDHEPIERCERIVKGVTNGPTYLFEDANRAYYAPASDRLNIPKLNQFDNAESYYSTLFHELIHSTGHASRLNREGITKHPPFGSCGYSKEELIAEIGASFLCAHAGIDIPPVTENSAAYLQGWLKVLKADKKLLFKAAAKAQKAGDYLLNIDRTDT